MDAATILEPWFRLLRGRLFTGYGSDLPYGLVDRRHFAPFNGRFIVRGHDHKRDRVDVQFTASSCWLHVHLPLQSRPQRRVEARVRWGPLAALAARRQEMNAGANDTERDTGANDADRDAGANEKYIALLSRIGEALLLTSVLAAVDYDAWLSSLQDVAEVKIPSELDSSEQLPCRYEINGSDVLYPGRGRECDGVRVNPADSYWSALLCESPSDAFTRDLDRLRTLLDLSRLEPTPVRVALPVMDCEVKANGGAAEVEYLQTTIALCKRLIDTNADKVVRFRFDSVDLDLWSVPIDPPSLEATAAFLTTCDVPIRSLLPPAGPSRLHANEREIPIKWNEMVCAAAGLTNRSLHLHSLLVCEPHLQAGLVEPLFIAVAKTQSIEALAIDMTTVEGTACEMHGEVILDAPYGEAAEVIRIAAEEIVRGRLECLGQTLLKAGSASSIKTLSIWAHNITTQQVESMAVAMADTGEDEHNGQPCGRGSSRLETLMVRLRLIDDHDEALTRLVALLGDGLTGLHLKASRVSDETMEAIMRHCPCLRRLWIEDASLNSMETFVRAYESGLPLESLTLESTNIEPDVFEEFLAVLGQQSAAAFTLRRLRFKRHSPFEWPPSTFDVLRQTLIANETLSHVRMLHHLYPDPARDRFYDTLGRGSHMTQPLAVDRRYAFISVLKTVDAMRGLDIANITALVFAFAADSVPRGVHVHGDE